MANQPRPTLGQKVRFTATVQKHREGDHKTHQSTFVSAPLHTPLEGVFVRYTVWSVGKTYWEVDGLRRVFDGYFPDEYREIWFVAVDAKQHPFAVFPEHCEVIE